MIRIHLGWAAGFILALAAGVHPARAQRVVHVTPETIKWGHFDADAKPVLTVKPGEVVAIDTIVGNASQLKGLGAAVDDPIREMEEMAAKVKDRGPGPHFLTGPVAIEGAVPGDVLEVEILEIRLRSPYGWMMIGRGGSGALPEEFRSERSKLVRLDRNSGTAEFAPGIRIPIHPFFGVLGVAPGTGRLGSGPPDYNGGNMDNRWLVAGARLFLPVSVPGALFEAGDGHAIQGDGELCGTAIETNLTGVFRFSLRKDIKLHWPRAETSTDLITMGFDKSLDEAARIATREMVDYLASEHGLSREDAYMLASAAVNLHVTQVANGVKGIHATLPKAIFTTLR